MAMQSVELKKEGLNREYKVTVPASAMAERVQQRLKEIAKTVKLPGFRPGKAPMPVLEQRYGDAVLGEVLEKAVNDGTIATLRDNKVRPAGQPNIQITQFDKGGDLEFTLAIEVLPEIKVVDVKTIAVEKPVAKVADETIEDAIVRIAKNNRRSEKVEEPRAAVTGDIVVIDYAGKLEDGTTKPGMSAVAYQLELGSNSFIAGFEDQLVGSKAGDDVTVNVQFPDQYGAADLAGKKAIFQVTVHEIRTPITPEMNDEFAKTMGLEDMNMLKKAIRDQMEGEYAQFTRMKMKRSLFDALDAAHTFDLPQSMVDAELATITEQMNQEKKSKGESEEMSEEDKAELKSIAERRVRLGLVLSEVGQANNITVTEQDMQRAVMDQARRYPGQEAQVFEMFRKNKQLQDNLRAPIFEEKVVDFILELAQVTEKEVSLAELTRDDDDDAEETAKTAEAKKGGKKK